MTKGWYGERQRHKLSAKGISSKDIIKIKIEKDKFEKTGCYRHYKSGELPRKLYHGTSKNGAENILKNGFSQSESAEAVLGFGVYFKCNPVEALEYGDTIIEVTLPEKYIHAEAELFPLWDLYYKNFYDYTESEKYIDFDYAKNNIHLDYLDEEDREDWDGYALPKEVIWDEYIKWIREETNYYNDVEVAVDDFQVMIPDTQVGRNFLNNIQKTAKIVELEVV